jgi:hypothetical protein
MGHAMMPIRLLTPLVVCLLLPNVATAATPQLRGKPDALSLLSGGSVDAVAGALRGYLVQNLSPVLYEASPGWGHTRKVPTGLTWKGKGLHVHPEVRHAERNHGTWRKIRVTADNLADTLVFDIRTVHTLEPGRVAFDVFLSFDVRVDYQEQKWDAGIKLFDGSTRLRLRIKLTLGCEVSARLQPSGTILPDAIIQLRVVRSDLRYDNFVVEHVPGVGGEMAKILGDAVKGGLHQWDPALERELIAHANAAIVKAAGTREVRLKLGALFAPKRK